MLIIDFILIFRWSVPQTDPALSMTDPAWKKQCSMLSYYQKLEVFALLFLQIKPVNIIFYNLEIADEVCEPVEPA